VSSGGLGASAYLAGALQLAVTLAGVAVTAVVVDRRRLAFLRGADRVAAVSLLAIGALLADHLLPLMAGAMTRITVPTVSLAMAVLAARFVPGGGERGAGAWTTLTGAARRAAIRAQGGPLRVAAARLRRGPPAAWASGLLAAATVLAVTAGSLAYMLATSRQPFTLVDIASFHLPNVARWIQSGSLWQVDQFLPYLWQGNYPQSGDVMLLAAVLPWHSDFAARYVDLPFLALTAVAVYAIARELEAPRASALVFSACVPALPIVALSAYQGAMPDAVMYATFAAGSLFLLRYTRTRRRPDLLLAGLGLGICFGVKWYSLTSVAAVLVVWLAAELARRRGARGLARDGAILVGLIVALGGVWLLRNLLESGDPLFPTRVRLLGLTLFDAPPDPYRRLAGFRVLDYIGDGHVWSTYISPSFTLAFRRIGEVLLAGSALAAALCLSRRGSQFQRARVLAVLACGLLLTFAYFDTPYSALGPRGAPVNTFVNTRYWVPALICAAPLCAWAAGRAGPFRVLVELAGALAVASGLRRGFTYPATADWLAGGALAIGLAGAAAAAGPRLAAWSPRTRSRALAGAGVGLAAAGVFFLYFQQRAFLRGRYVSSDPVLVALARDPARHRVALAGLWDSAGVPPILPAFGPRLANRVDYVGPWVRHSLGQYGQPAPLDAALRRGGYDVVVLGTAAFPGRSPTPPAWVQAAGYRVVGADRRLLVFARR
jgi:hypothetical protein